MMKNKQKNSNIGKSAYSRGHFYEKVATIILRIKGYRIISVNLPGKRGFNVSEIDIIAVKNKTVIFIEVKYRRKQNDTYFAVTETRKRRIINAASLFIAEHPEYSDYEIRFDAILFSGILKMEHIKEAFYS